MRSILESAERSVRSRAHREAAFRFVAFLLVAWSVVACSRELPAPIGSAHPGEAPRRGGILRSASFGDIRALDPANMADGLAPQILQSLFAGLVDYDRSGAIAPDLADRWTVSEDGTTYRFVLREGVRFHDGEELVAEDVKRSVERALHPSSPNPNASYFASIAGYDDFVAKKTEAIAGVTVEGRYVVSFKLGAPDSAFLPLLAMHPLRPVCRSAGNRYGDAWHPCGAGPFKLLPGGWDRGRQVTLVRHDGYFRPGLPYLDRVSWSFHVNFTTQRFKFTTGEQEILRDFLAPDLMAFQADTRWTPFGEFEIEKQIAGVAMNTEMAPFDNVEIRRAVASGINREEIRLIRASNMTVADKPIPPGIEGYDPSIPGQRFDYAAALEHMKRAGYPYDPVTRTGGYPHVVRYIAYAQGLDEFVSQIVQQQLLRIGIRIDIQLVNYPTFLALRGRRGQTAMGGFFWQQDYPEAGSYLEPLFHSRSISDENSNNVSFYKNPRVDELVDRARRETDLALRKEAYGEAQRILCDEAPWAFAYHYRFYAQWHPYVHDYRPHPMWATDVTRSWVDRIAGPVASRAVFSGDALAKLFGRADTSSGRRENP